MNKLKNKTKGVDATAYWMTGCRAALPELSRDVYAEYWLNKPSRERHKQYVAEVSPTENIALSLRNRFFLEEISRFLSENLEAVFVNLGAGFSSYPFLMPEHRKYCEVDCEGIIEIKKQKVSEFTKKGIFPKRDIAYFAVDLNDQSDLNRLLGFLSGWIGGRKSFILAEGLVYYLRPQRADDLFSMIRSVQVPGSRFGVVTWPPETVTLPVYRRFEGFLKKEIKGNVAQFSFHDQSSIRSMEGYNAVNQTGYYELSRRFGMNPLLEKSDDVFWEDLTILERI